MTNCKKQSGLETASELSGPPPTCIVHVGTDVHILQGQVTRTDGTQAKMKDKNAAGAYETLAGRIPGH